MRRFILPSWVGDSCAVGEEENKSPINTKKSPTFFEKRRRFSKKRGRFSKKRGSFLGEISEGGEGLLPKWMKSFVWLRRDERESSGNFASFRISYRGEG